MKRFSWFRLVFGLLAAGGVMALWCLLHRKEGFTPRNIADGLLVGAGVVFLFSVEFLHTYLGNTASYSSGSVANAYTRVKADKDRWDKPNRAFIPEYLAAAALAAAAGGIMSLLR